jgi:hypothetical protein
MRRRQVSTVSLLFAFHGLLLGAFGAADARGFEPFKAWIRDAEWSKTTVWRSERDWEKGTALFRAKQPELAPKPACVVEHDTIVLVTGAGPYATYRVLVLGGPAKGCEGNVFFGDTVSRRTLPLGHPVPADGIYRGPGQRR